MTITSRLTAMSALASLVALIALIALLSLITRAWSRAGRGRSRLNLLRNRRGDLLVSTVCGSPSPWPSDSLRLNRNRRIRPGCSFSERRRLLPPRRRKLSAGMSDQRLASSHCNHLLGNVDFSFSAAARFGRFLCCGLSSRHLWLPSAVVSALPSVVAAAFLVRRPDGVPLITADADCHRRRYPLGSFQRSASGSTSSRSQQQCLRGWRPSRTGDHLSRLHHQLVQRVTPRPPLEEVIQPPSLGSRPPAELKLTN